MTEESTILNPPIVVDLGKASRKRIKRLKRGKGRLMGEVQEAIESVAGQLGTAAEGKELLPVVVLYRRKRRRRGGAFPFL